MVRVRGGAALATALAAAGCINCGAFNVGVNFKAPSSVAVNSRGKEPTIAYSSGSAWGLNPRSSSSNRRSSSSSSSRTGSRSRSGLFMTKAVDLESRAAAAMAADEEQQKTYDAKRLVAKPVKNISRPFPLSLVVGQEAIKTALLLAAVNPSMGGVVISGRRGTAKSVMARAIHKVMPPIEKVKGSQYNIDPERPDQVDAFTKSILEKEGKELKDLETEIVEAPFVQVPINVMEDRLLGSVDVEKSVASGKTVFLPGLLAAAHRGILYVDDINLLDTELANIMLTAITDGWVNVEREGISMRYPCKPLLIATFNPEEADLRDHLLDRIAVALSADADLMTEESRIEAVKGALDWGDMTEEGLKEIEDEEDNVMARIIFARESLKETQLATTQITYLCEEAARADTMGHRAEIFACEVARASAALNDRRPSAEDLKLAVKLAIAPRGKFMQMQQEQEEMMEPPPPPPPPPKAEENPDDGESEMDEKDEDEDSEEDPPEDEEEPDEEPPDEDQDQPDEDEAPAVPQEFMFAIDSTAIDPELLDFAGKSNSGKSGGRGLIFSEERGRYIKPMLPKGKVRRLAVDATMRAAAPYQRPRRERAAGTEKSVRKVFIEQADVRTKKMARKAGSLIIFCVDASGSMALNRMNAAKGAAMSLLQEAYQSRDKICLIPFQGDRAEVLLPPTKSIAMAKKRLETMPCGGGSPLAHAINLAVRTGVNAQKSGDVGRVIVVCISDGRANVPLSVASGDPIDPEDKPTREDLKEEVLNTAKALRAMGGFNLVMLDTENKFVSTGIAKEIAAAAGGKYHYIPKATDKAIAGVASDAINSIKGGSFGN